MNKFINLLIFILMMCAFILGACAPPNNPYVTAPTQVPTPAPTPAPSLPSVPTAPLEPTLIVPDPFPGAVLYLPGSPGNGTMITDASGNGNNGVIRGATWTRLPSGLSVLGFNLDFGTDDYVDCGGVPELVANTGDLTILLWFMPLSFRLPTILMVYKHLWN